MELFDKYIDEFVDWTTGEDTSNKETEQKSRVSSTGGLPVSGGSIRELLQTRLKKPFVSYEDVTSGLYRMFSSESTRDKWIRMNTPGSPDYDPDNSTHLELFNFVRPADVSLTFVGLDPNPKYIINGDSTSAASQLSYTVNLQKGEGVFESDAFTVTYKITDSNGVVRTSVEEKDASYVNTNTVITKNIYSMLTVGKNEVTVSFKAKNSSASNAITFAVYLIEFTLESSFAFQNHWTSTANIDVPISIKRSDDSLPLKVFVYVDDYSNSAATWETSNGGTNPTATISLTNTYAQNITSTDHIKHKLKIEAQMHDQNTGATYYSNVLFFDFVVASNTAGIMNRFVNISYSSPYNRVSTLPSSNPPEVILQLTQYEPFSLPWAYYTDRSTTEQTLNIEWAVRTGTTEYTYSPITVMQGTNNSKSENLRFIPDFSTSEGDNVYLVALYNGAEIDSFPIQVAKSSLSIVETSGYDLKLQAYGKTNQSSDRNVWADTINGVTTNFVGINYDDNSGWNNNSFVTSGVGSYAQINYCPIPSMYNLSGQGKTIEIDFKPERVVNEGDLLVIIGDPNRGHIRITTNQASLYNGVNHIIHTNYKANERIKLAFVFNPVSSLSKDSNLFFIINNGVLERAVSYGEAANFTSDAGIFKIGDSASGIRIYNIRGYNKALTYDEELSNYIYDSDNKSEILSRNDIYSASIIDYTKVKNKIDTVLLTGDLSKILSQSTGKEDSESTITFKRECITDSSKTFEVTNGMIRKHGQSTLNYPITSMKIWTNKASNSNIVPSIDLSETQRAEGLNKNRYVMKTGAIPANKFVLQANYADSSGVHNGALLRLIQDTWYNAQINGQYILRTAPQLFSSGNILIHNDEQLHEDGSWVEGYGNTILSAGKTWTDIAKRNFPYIIRNAPDSFPCAIFYKNGPEDGYHFLGQYVFMDDKKSDYIYGERSIYHFGTGNDPFVLKTENTKNGANGKQDTDANCVWDNKNVLRIEIVLPNTTLSSYMDFNITDSAGTHACTDIKYNEAGNPSQYYWEDYFEMIYPDTDDIEADDSADGMTKFDPNSKFVKKAKPFVDFLRWITDCNRNYNKDTDWWKANTYSSTQEAFEHTAAQHLDLYKVAAYYIFFLRFGLVDSVERNAQLKTYDGIHWHYEPWDMDIALGNTNQGALVLDPPMTRNTFEPGTTTYAYSGRSQSTSNVLWDCLEAWDYWSNTVVPNVAQALYEAGLDYDNIIRMFDEEYAEKWSETMYNQSGHFKYIDNGGATWLAWLQGSRTSHRHWWISTSMNYYDAKWSCGSFNEHRVRLFADKVINPIGTDIVTIKPTSETFFKIAQQEGKTSLGTLEANPNNPARFDISTYAFSAKDPSYIYGGTFIEEIDLSCLAEKLKAADFTLCYDSVLGAPIKKLNIGLPYKEISDIQYEGKTSGTEIRLTAYDSTTLEDAFESLQVLDITGQASITSTQDLITSNNRKNITDFYAIGTGINSFSSSTSGNKFNVVKLPGVTTTKYSNQPDVISEFNTFVMENSSWNTLEFWNTVKSGDIEYEKDENGEIATDDEGNAIIKANIATFTKSSVPHQISTVIFRGSTANNECAGQFVLDWIDSIEQNLKSQNPSYTEEDLYNVIKTKTFQAENINWGVPGQNLKISYKDVARIAHFNNANNGGGLIKGYIILSDKEELSAEQLNNLTNWFGPSVFTKGSTGSNLVIDQELAYTRITFSNAETINGVISLVEGKTTGVSATKFTLSETDNDNYLWSLSAVNPNNGSTVTGNTILSCKIYKGEDGQMYITASENGTYGDYDLKITVDIDRVQYTQVLRIVSVKLPDDMSIVHAEVSQNNARKFYIDNTIGTMSELFRGKVRDTYVLFESGQQVEFYPQFTQTPGVGGYATLKSVNISINNDAYIQQSTLTGQADTIENRVSIPSTSGYLYYTKTATRGGIVFGLSEAPQEMMLVTLNMTAIVGERTYNKTINIVLYDDSTSMYNQGGGVQAALQERFSAIYGISPTYFYKTDLFSIYGTLDFSGYVQNVSDVYDIERKPLIRHLTNVQRLIFTGCYNILPTGSYFGEYNNSTQTLLFQEMPHLTEISFNGCNANDNSIIDLTNCPSITKLDLRGTQAGINLVNSSISTLQLGSPKVVVITNPKVLTKDGISIENTNNLDTIKLSNINVGDASQYVTSSMHGYNVFDKLQP